MKTVHMGSILLLSSKDNLNKEFPLIAAQLDRLAEDF